MLASDPLPAFPGILELMVAALASPDWVVAIATGSTEEKTMAVLISAKIPYEQMVCITGSDPHARKPAPDMFLAAAEQLGVEARPGPAEELLAEGLLERRLAHASEQADLAVE